MGPAVPAASMAPVVRAVRVVPAVPAGRALDRGRCEKRRRDSRRTLGSIAFVDLCTKNY